MNSLIPTPIYAPVATVLPTMYYNTISGISGKIKVEKNTTTTISDDYVDLEIGENCTMTIEGSVYGKIDIDKGSTVLFTSSSFDLETLKAEGKNSGTLTTVQFSADAQVRVKEKVEIGKYTSVNTGNYHVIFYIGEENGHKGELKVKAKGTSFYASAYVPQGDITVNENPLVSFPCATMTGQFIADKIKSEGKYILWTWHSCGVEPTPPAPSNPVVLTGKDPIAGDDALFNIYHVPNNGRFIVSINSLVEDRYSIFVYNSMGKTLFEKRDVVVNGLTEEIVDLQPIQSGIYFVIF
ncbi:MAG: hypothetical protein IH596_07370 [Bacteroidales bacterium]|nr:hypothetical protein [Bacteroidales bacterium]